MVHSLGRLWVLVGGSKRSGGEGKSIHLLWLSSQRTLIPLPRHFTPFKNNRLEDFGGGCTPETPALTPVGTTK